MNNFESADVADYKRKLIIEFEDMAERGTLLVGKNVTQQDLLVQIIGTIVTDEFKR